MRLAGNTRSEENYTSMVRRHFDDMADWYSISTDWVESGDLLCAIAERVKQGPILDVGCGPGVVGKYIAEHLSNVELVSLDISPKMCKQAQKAGLSVIQATAEQVPIKGGAIGTIVCRQGLHYFNIDAVLLEWKRLLSNEGLAVVAQVGSVNEQQTLWWKDLKAVLQPLRRAWFSIDSVGELIENHGWHSDPVQIVKVRNCRPIRQFFSNCDTSRPTNIIGMLDHWQRTAPADVEFEYSGDHVMFVQYWLVWSMWPSP